MSDNTKKAPAVEAAQINPLLSILKDAAKWLHAAYDRPPQTPEAKAMLDLVDLAIQFADEVSHADAEQPVEAAGEPVAIMDAALTEICNWPDGGSRYGQGNIQRFAKEKLNEARRARFNAAPQPASEPVGYVMAADLEELAQGNGAVISPKTDLATVPLFRQPASEQQAARGLSDEQREAIGTAIRIMKDAGFSRTVTGLESILAAKGA